MLLTLRNTAMMDFYSVVSILIANLVRIHLFLVAKNQSGIYDILVLVNYKCILSTKFKVSTTYDTKSLNSLLNINSYFPGYLGFPHVPAGYERGVCTSISLS